VCTEHVDEFLYVELAPYMSRLDRGPGGVGGPPRRARTLGGTASRSSDGARVGRTVAPRPERRTDRPASGPSGARELAFRCDEELPQRLAAEQPFGTSRRRRGRAGSPGDQSGRPACLSARGRGPPARVLVPPRRLGTPPPRGFPALAFRLPGVSLRFFCTEACGPRASARAVKGEGDRDVAEPNSGPSALLLRQPARSPVDRAADPAFR
jgi:hypothetical protein